MLTAEGDETVILCHACNCAEHILQRYLRVPVVKARLSLSTPEDFDLAVVRLASKLQAQASLPEQSAIAAASEMLDVDWRDTTAQQRRELVELALAAAAGRLGSAPERLHPTLSEAAKEVTVATREDARAAGLQVGSNFTAFDRRAMHFLTRSETLYIRNQCGRRLADFGHQIRTGVAKGMAAGWGRDDIRESLAAAASRALVGRGRAYWQVVAGAFVGRGRSYCQLGTYADAGLTHYRVIAVMDERTSAVCRAMHGRILSVVAGIDAFKRAEYLVDPSAIKAINPWPSLAELKAGAADMLTFPPYHSLCRTVTVGLVDRAR
jgi:hypothetical protein